MSNILTDDIKQAFIKIAPELEHAVRSTKLVLEPTLDPPFEQLVRSIIFQQLSGKAATTIHNRFLELVGDLTPKRILELEQEQLRSVGFSRQKAGYVKNVAAAFDENGKLEQFQSATDLRDLDPNEIIELFTTIKGVGPWTVEMYLIFGLGHLNIFSATDLGVRKGVQQLYDLDQLPSPAAARKLTQHWNPYKSLGTILCWRIQD